jgi:nucleotide-binding universal stress UspA family protein
MVNSIDAARHIVVGVDGSSASKTALAWAVRQAQQTGVALRAVTAWNVPSNYDLEPGLTEGIDVGGGAERALKQAVEEVTGVAPEVHIEQVIARGHAAEILVEESKDADLLVVGSRGRGGFARTLLGSVSQHCVHHARCPVVVVRDKA